MHATPTLSATESFPMSLQSLAAQTTLSHLGAHHRSVLTYPGHLGISEAPGAPSPRFKCSGFQVSLVVTLTCHFLSLQFLYPGLFDPFTVRSTYSNPRPLVFDTIQNQFLVGASFLLPESSPATALCYSQNHSKAPSYTYPETLLQSVAGSPCASNSCPHVTKALVRSVQSISAHSEWCL